MTKSGAGHRRPGRVPPSLKAVAAGVLGAVFAFGHADGYRFAPIGSEVRSRDAVRWSPEVWGPGDTLVFDIAPGPLFEVYFGSPEGLIRVAERAMATWSAIPTADISWRIEGVAGPRVLGDSRSTIFLDPDPAHVSGVNRVEKARGARKVWDTVECDLRVGSQFTRVRDDVKPEHLEEHRQLMVEWAEKVLLHEFGHCLGLEHAGDHSTTGRWDSRLHQTVHPGDPVMSYGYDQLPQLLTADDAVGASLLRPREGWQRTTGSIAGAVSVDGEPAPYVHVWALPAGDRSLHDRIEVLSDGSGSFLIEGLDPGEYALWAQPVAALSAIRFVVRAGAPLDLEDAVRGALLRVRAGQTTGTSGVSLRRGRAPRPPPREAPPPRKRPSLTKEGVAPTEVCPGVWVAAGRPYPPNGPLWFSIRDFGIGRDRWWGTTVTVEWSAGSEGVFLDWAGTYRNWSWKREDGEETADFFDTFEEFLEGGDADTPLLDVAISDYRIRKTAAGVRHTMDIAWPESTETVLRFRSEDDACDGEPTVVCDLGGCEIRHGG